MAADSGGGWVVLGILGLAIYSCSGDGGSSDEEYAYEDDSGGDYSYSDVYDAGGSDYEDEREDFDEDAAREAAEEELASESYLGLGSPYGCTIDCSGHEAGYAWAAEGNPDYGFSSSQSFDEGQQAFDDAVEERIDEMRDDYENGEDPDY